MGGGCGQKRDPIYRGLRLSTQAKTEEGVKTKKIHFILGIKTTLNYRIILINLDKIVTRYTGD